MKVKLQQLRIIPFLCQMNRSSKYGQTKIPGQISREKPTRHTQRCGETLAGPGPLLSVLYLIMIKGLIYPSSIHSGHKSLLRTGPCVKCLGSRALSPSLVY